MLPELVLSTGQIQEENEQRCGVSMSWGKEGRRRGREGEEVGEVLTVMQVPKLVSFGLPRTCNREEGADMGDKRTLNLTPASSRLPCCCISALMVLWEVVGDVIASRTKTIPSSQETLRRDCRSGDDLGSGSGNEASNR